MKQSFSISLVILALFGLWLFNTGRVTSFITWLKTSPAQGTLPGQGGARPKQTSSAAGVANTAACAAAASGGVVTPACAGTFLNELTDPIGTISSGISTLTFGVIKL
jgi:hypothetical protein